MIKEINPPQAWKMSKSDPNAVILDVRSRLEYEYVGHPISAINIPWKEPPAWDVDAGFVEKVYKTLRDSRPDAGPVENLLIMAICRSGARSRDAGLALAEVGFTRVYNVLEGFEGDRDENKQRGNINGWRFHGLPWEQS